MSEIARVVVEQLLNALRPAKSMEVPEGSRIFVHAAVSRFSVLYEKIRNAVDYKDEHLLRKAAIIRILKRQLILERESEVIAKNLIRELIGARYLPNGEISECLIDQTSLSVEKYLVVSKTRAGSSAHLEWLMRLVAVEIEDILIDNSRDKSLVAFLYERLADRIQVQGFQMEQSEVGLQTYLACARTFTKADDEILGYKLLRAYLPEWLRAEEWLQNPLPIAERLIGLERRIRLSLTHPLSQKFLRAVKPWAVALNVICKAVIEKPDEASMLFEKTEVLDVTVSRIAEKNYREAKAKLRRGAVRAMIYLFMTKMLVALALEVPVEYWMFQEISKGAFVLNLLFPPVMMFFVWLLIKIPGKDNTDRIKKNVYALLSREGVAPRDIRIPRKRSIIARMIFRLAYVSMFVIIFGLIGIILVKLDFTWISSLIFIFFLCVVSFFAFRLRQNAREYIIVEGKDSFVSVLLDFISYPILRAGKILSRSISRINVFLFFFDFMFEAPFKMLLSILEEWFAFMKEKKEELQ